MLTLEIEYLTGVSSAALTPDSRDPDWPPQPDRAFSALVAAWASRGENEAEASALRWLERLQPPRILASVAHARTVATVFVPPNDASSARTTRAKEVLAGYRKRQPRQSVAVRPVDPVARIQWQDVDPDEATLQRLDAIARDVSYLGHSASLTRCRFVANIGGVDGRDGGPPKRTIYDGRLDELRRLFAANIRPSQGPPPTVREPLHREQTNTFDQRWLILEHVGGTMPDLRAAALVSKAIRNSLLSGYERLGRAHAIPEIVSGHDSAGKPSLKPHLAVVPLAFVGSTYADGRVMGFAIVPPAGSGLLDDSDFRAALRGLCAYDDDRHVLTVSSRAGTSATAAFSVRVSPTFEVARRSLDPRAYTRTGQVFATVTPIVLDRHLKAAVGGREKEMVSQVKRACTAIGLPEPTKIVPDKHSAINAAPSAYRSGTSPEWVEWGMPPSLTSRTRTHAVIEFGERVDGPVLLGAGRFVGLGLCRCLDSEGRWH